MAYSAVELSKYIITKCAMENKPISNLQLQKIRSTHRETDS